MYNWHLPFQRYGRALKCFGPKYSAFGYVLYSSELATSHFLRFHIEQSLKSTILTSSFSMSIRTASWISLKIGALRISTLRNYYWRLFNTQARSPCVATAYVRLQFLISRAPCYINKPPPRPCILYTPLDTSYTHMYVVPAAGSLFQRVRDNSAVNVTYDNDDGLLCDHTCYIQM